MNKIFSNFGQTLVELLITIGLAALLIPALLGAFYVTRSGGVQMDQRIQATSYLKEAQEALRIIQANDWVNLVSSPNPYHPVALATTWSLAENNEVIGDFTRGILISDVFRDVNGNIVATGGLLDPSTKKITITVSWGIPLATSINSITYLTRHKNLSHTETTVSDFTPGISNPPTNGITITNTDGGEMVLGAGGGGGDWCQPSLVLQTEDLPKSGVANAITAIEGRVFAATGDNSSGVSYASVDVTTTYPPDPNLGQTFDGYKTNGVFGETGFAYLATDNNGKEVVIINLNAYSDPPTNSKYKEEGYFDAPGNGDGNSVYVAGDYGYMTSGNKFYVFNLSSKSGSRAQVLSAVTLSGTGVRTFVVGDFAYVVTSATTNQLQIINISNLPTQQPSIVGQLTIDGLSGRDIHVNSSGTRAYVVTANSATKNELFIVNVQNPTSPQLVSGGVYNSNGMDPKGVTVVTGNRAIIVGTGGTLQYQVVNINTETAPTACGPGLTVSSGIHGVASVLQSDGYAYSYIITGDSGSELKIILGGAGAGSSYVTEGLFESATFDMGREVSLNTIFVNSSTSPNTSLQFRVAIKHAINNSCSSVVFSASDFVGYDGQTSTYFAASGGLLPFNSDGSDYENPGQCVRYRAYLSSLDSTQTPVVYDVSLNYSP